MRVYYMEMNKELMDYIRNSDGKDLNTMMSDIDNIVRGDFK